MDASNTSQPFKLPYVNPAHNSSSAQPQSMGHPFPGHFKLSEPQDQLRPTAVKAETAHQTPKPSAALVSSPSAPSSSGGGGKRSRNRPPSRASATATTSNVNLAIQSKSIELAPAPLRKKPKLGEREVPESISVLLPQAALFNRLVEFEDKIDTIMARKKAEIQETLKHPLRVRKTLRLYVFNTFENQGLNADERKDTAPPSWTLKMFGRILEDGKDPIISGKEQKVYPEFSSFLKKITIYLDQSLYPNNHVVLWENAKSPVLHDGFEVNRNGDKEFTARIRLEMNSLPERFKLSTALSEMLGIDAETRPRVLVAIWHYIKTKKLQIPGDPSYFSCDHRLQKVFGEEKIRFSSISQKINPHLTTLPPIHLEHRIKLSGSCPSGTTCYDIAVDVPVLQQKDLTAFLADTDTKKEVDGLEEVIRDTMNKMREHNRKRSFFEGFSQSPAAFIDFLLDSQSKDLKLAGGDVTQNKENEDKSDFYNQNWVEDAVVRYLNRKSGGSDTPASA